MCTVHPPVAHEYINKRILIYKKELDTHTTRGPTGGSSRRKRVEVILRYAIQILRWATEGFRYGGYVNKKEQFPY